MKTILTWRITIVALAYICETFIRKHSYSASALSLSTAEPARCKFLQVISDVDDTLKSSGGIKAAGVPLGGIDTQYERGDFYPGVFEFMFQLSMFPLKEGDLPAKVAVLTARAEEFKAALELKDSSKLAVAFKKTGENGGIRNWGLGP